ncbi:MAG: hypothetical protein AAF357_08410 [Verrucomicrobiota bacterium]
MRITPTTDRSFPENEALLARCEMGLELRWAGRSELGERPWFLTDGWQVDDRREPADWIRRSVTEGARHERRVGHCLVSDHSPDP